MKLIFKERAVMNLNCSIKFEEPNPYPFDKLRAGSFSGLCFTHKFSKRSHSYPNGILPQSPGLGGTTYPGNTVQKAFLTPKVLRQSSAIWAQPRWGCFELGRTTQGRPAAVAESQPWAGGRNPVGIKGNEAAPQIANLWVMHSSSGGGRGELRLTPH